jgi:hypothetical protein
MQELSHRIVSWTNYGATTNSITALTSTSLSAKLRLSIIFKDVHCKLLQL